MSALLRLLCVASAGVFAGAMLTEGFVLVPYWRALAPADFLSWYAANDQRLFGFFAPLTAAAALIAVVAALASFWEGHPGRWAGVVAAGLMVVAVGTFFVYFEQTNASFAAGTIAVERVPAELARWASWHWARTGISIVALGAAALSCRGR